MAIVNYLKELKEQKKQLADVRGDGKRGEVSYSCR